MGMTPDAVAEKLRTTPEYIDRIESGEVDPTFSYLVKLAGAMNSDIPILFSPKEEQQKPKLPGHNVSKPASSR